MCVLFGAKYWPVAYPFGEFCAMSRLRFRCAFAAARLGRFNVSGVILGLRGLRSIRAAAYLAATVLGFSAGAAAATTASIFPSGSFRLYYQDSGSSGSARRPGASSGDPFGSNAYAPVTIKIGRSSETVAAGGLALDVNNRPSTAFTAFCLDLAHEMQSGASYTAVAPNPTGDVFNAVTPGQQAEIQHLFDAVYSPILLTSATNSVAFQLALWEIVTETSSTLSLSSGSFRATTPSRGFTGDPNSIAQANAYLADMQAYGGAQRYDVTYLQGAGSCSKWGGCCQGSQNLVTVSAVPVPAAGFLLLSAFAGLGALARRRKGAARAAITP